MRVRRRVLFASVLGALGATLCGASCAGEGAPSAEEALSAAYGVPVVQGVLPEAARAGVPLSAGAAVHWELAWDLDGTEAAPNGGRRFVTDLGYSVTLTAAHIATVGLEAVPCVTEASVGDALRGFLGPRTARADHAYDHDESWLSSVLVESALGGGVTRYGTSHASGGLYCTAFSLAMPVAEAAADGTWMLGQSVSLAGAYVSSAAGSERPRPFQASLSLSLGGLSELALSEGARLPEGAEAFDEVTITVTRALRTSLDGLALESVSSVDLADGFLRNVVQSAVVTVVPAD